MANVEILVLLVAATLLMPLRHTTEAAEHAVGGSAGWTIPPQGATSLYTSFAANTTFRLNDILVFNFTTGFHNVVTLSKKHYDSCNVSEVMQSFDTAPARITLNRTGEFYFACAFPSHCSLGQKLSIHVTAGSSSLAPAEAPLSPPPAASGAAMPLVAVTLPILFIAVAINVLF